VRGLVVEGTEPDDSLAALPSITPAILDPFHTAQNRRDSSFAPADNPSAAVTAIRADLA
jgi:hypothetical protein